MTHLSVRTARGIDGDAVEHVLQRSYSRLLGADYPPSVLISALPLMARAQPALLTSGTYFVVERAGQVVGVGGWTPHAPGRNGVETPGLAHIRHVATDPDVVRAGVGATLMNHIVATARASGRHRFEALSTRTAVPFYAAMGFDVVEELDVIFPGGLAFPSIRMIRAAQ